MTAKQIAMLVALSVLALVVNSEARAGIACTTDQVRTFGGYTASECFDEVSLLEATWDIPNQPVFGRTDWTLADLWADRIGGTSLGDKSILLSFPFPNRSDDGFWALSGFDNFADVMLVLQPNSGPWGAYLLNENGSPSGIWTLEGLSGNGINSVSVWYSPSSAALAPPPAPVPEPATPFLLGTGLFGLGLMRRRKAA